ncbi:MAG: clan aspartic protease [Bacteroidetes bacterium]|jgi:hypothetical protein|nr:clan aspartic protease [Bacteroidota bacterium]
MNKTVLKIKLLNIDNDGYHLSIKAKLNGKLAHLLIDTGASRTVFDLNRMSKFIKTADMQENERLSTGLGTNTMKSQVAQLKKMELGDLVIPDYKAIFLDLSHVNISYVNAGLNPIDGVVGSDILHDHKAVLDYDKLELVLRSIEKKNLSPRKAAKKSVKRTAKKTTAKTKKKNDSKRR